MVGNSQSEAGSAIFPRDGAIRLLEGLEYDLGLLSCHAYAGVPHRELQVNPLIPEFQQSDGYRDFSLLSKLDRIGAQIDQNLAQTQRVIVDPEKWTRELDRMPRHERGDRRGKKAV